MDDSVDKQLADHVRRTLNGYQTPYQLGAWEQFDRARQPAKQRLGAWYRYATAACLLGVTLLAPLWLDDARLPSLVITGPVANRLTPLGKALTQEKQPVVLPAGLGTASNEEIVATERRRKRNRLISVDSWDDLVLDKNLPSLPSRVPLLRAANKAKSTDLVVQSGNDSASVLLQLTTITPPPPTNSIINRSAQPLTAPAISTSATTQTTLVSVATALALTETATPDQQTERRRAVTWSLTLAPQTAYVPNGHSSLTLGGGVLSDIALSGRFSVSTGLSIARQIVGIAPPVNQVMTTSGRQLTGTNARFIFIDLPLNLTYQVGKRTRPLFRVSAGLSSLMFLNQQYADTYQTLHTVATQVIDQNGRPQIIQQVTQTEEVLTRPTIAFRDGYWGRLLNLSVGIERSLSRRTVFAVEPYLKYPLGPLTQENLSIGSAGLSLRIGIR